MKIRAKATGWTVAAAAAALFVAGCAHDMGGGGTAEVQCIGVNACKGQGFVMMSAEACEQVGGKT